MSIPSYDWIGLLHESTGRERAAMAGLVVLVIAMLVLALAIS